MIQNGQKWSKWSKMVQMVKNGQNGGPDLKRARRTGPSARRARGTKSRGPKGLQLEVGARRAPRLLVANICFGVPKAWFTLGSNFQKNSGIGDPLGQPFRANSKTLVLQNFPKKIEIKITKLARNFLTKI